MISIDLSASLLTLISGISILHTVIFYFWLLYFFSYIISIWIFYFFVETFYFLIHWKHAHPYFLDCSYNSTFKVFFFPGNFNIYNIKGFTFIDCLFLLRVEIFLVLHIPSHLRLYPVHFDSHVI